MRIVDPSDAEYRWSPEALKSWGGKQYRIQCCDDLFWVFAASADVMPDGSLVLRNAQGDVNYAFARGAWRHCLPVSCIDGEELVVGWYARDEAHPLARGGGQMQPRGRGAVMASAPQHRMVYFALDRDRDVVKIGCSQDPEARVAALQAANASRLEMLCAVPGSEDLERDLHRRFRHLRVGGEWFRAAPELMDYIEVVSADAGRLTEAAQETDAEEPA